MKKIIILLVMMVFVLTGCDQGQYNEIQLAQQKEQISQLQSEITQLQLEKDKLQKEVVQEKVDKGIAKYMVTLNIKQSHFTLDVSKHIKDSLNEIQLQLSVDKEFYDSVEIGTVLDDSFRAGSFLMEGSFGSWDIKVVKKEIK